MSQRILTLSSNQNNETLPKARRGLIRQIGTLNPAKLISGD